MRSGALQGAGETSEEELSFSLESTSPGDKRKLVGIGCTQTQLPHRFQASTGDYQSPLDPAWSPRAVLENSPRSEAALLHGVDQGQAEPAPMQQSDGERKAPIVQLEGGSRDACKAVIGAAGLVRRKSRKPSARRKKSKGAGARSHPMPTEEENISSLHHATSCFVGSTWAAQLPAVMAVDHIYRVATIAGIAVRIHPDVDAERTGIILRHNQVFEVSAQVAGADGRLYLKLRNIPGWVFDDAAIDPEDPSVEQLAGEQHEFQGISAVSAGSPWPSCNHHLAASSPLLPHHLVSEMPCREHVEPVAFTFASPEITPPVALARSDSLEGLAEAQCPIHSPNAPVQVFTSTPRLNIHSEMSAGTYRARCIESAGAKDSLDKPAAAAAVQERLLTEPCALFQPQVADCPRPTQARMIMPRTVVSGKQHVTEPRVNVTPPRVFPPTPPLAEPSCQEASGRSSRAEVQPGLGNFLPLGGAATEPSCDVAEPRMSAPAPATPPVRRALFDPPFASCTSLATEGQIFGDAAKRVIDDGLRLAAQTPTPCRRPPLQIGATARPPLSPAAPQKQQQRLQYSTPRVAAESPRLSEAFRSAMTGIGGRASSPALRRSDWGSYHMVAS